MYRLSYEQYFNKVYGCWMGKCISGTIGAPYEGMKELLDFEYNPIFLENMLPNDDLDLQVLWLEVLENKGVNFTSEDLAEAFAAKCPYSPGEYAVFKKNYKRGIHPPTCGSFNNRYYIEGMGSPIRSEIWACIAPGNPGLASELAGRDAVLDHQGNSVYAEQFFSALQAAAFFESDLDRLIDEGMKVVPPISKFASLIRDVVNWCKAFKDWKYVRSKIIRGYGHPDTTNLFQNIGFTILALYFGEMDFIKTTMIALNCGFDTDCSCATAGAVLGIIHGAEEIMQNHGFEDKGYVLGVDVSRRSNSVYDLAEDTCRMGICFNKARNHKVTIEGYVKEVITIPEQPNPLVFSVEYENNLPAVGVGECREVTLYIKNQDLVCTEGYIKIMAPEGWNLSLHETHIKINPGETQKQVIKLFVPNEIEILQDTNIVHVTTYLKDGREIFYSFGVVGAAIWRVFGPFWDNNVKVPKLAYRESYWNYMAGKNEEDSLDVVRNYHLNTTANLEKEYMTLEELEKGSSGKIQDAANEGIRVNIYEDLFSVNDILGFQGPCVIYMARDLISLEDRKVGIHIGHTDAFKLWINGELVAERDTIDWWTAENLHKLNCEVNKGINKIVVKLVRRSAKADFSLIFAHGGACTEHYTDFASANLI